MPIVCWYDVETDWCSEIWVNSVMNDATVMTEIQYWKHEQSVQTTHQYVHDNVGRVSEIDVHQVAHSDIVGTDMFKILKHVMCEVSVQTVSHVRTIQVFVQGSVLPYGHQHVHKTVKCHIVVMDLSI